MQNKVFLIIGLVLALALVSYGYFAYFQKPANSLTGQTPVLDEPGYQLAPIDWNSADPVWMTFAAQFLENMRQIDANTPRAKLPGYAFDRVFVEVKSPLISKFLPRHKIYTETHTTFAFNTETKEITNIANGWRAAGDEPYYRNPNFSDFIKTRKIQLESRESAIEFTKFVEQVYRWGHSNPFYWKLNAEKKDGVWVAQRDYVGPPEYSIVVPTVWEMVVDNQNYVVEIRQQRQQI